MARILLITNRFPPGKGVRATVSRELVRDLVALGHDVTLLLPRRWAAAPELPELQSLGESGTSGTLQVRSSKLWGLLLFLGASLDGKGLRPRLLRPFLFYTVFLVTLFCGRHDVTIATRAVPFGNLGEALSRVWKCGIVLILTGDELVPGRFGGKPLLARALQVADRVLVPTLLQRDLLARLFPAVAARLVPMALPLRPPTGDSPRSPDDARAELGLSPDDRPLILAVGRLLPHKGFDTLLLAMPLIRQAFPGSVCVIVGEGPQRRELEEIARGLGLADGAVRFLGEVPDTTLDAAYSAADVFALPNRTLGDGLTFEGAGLAPLEAAWRGVPLVLGQSGACAEHFDHGLTALLAQPPSDPEIVAANVVRLLQDKALAQALAKSAQDTVAPVLEVRARQSQLDALLTPVLESAFLRRQEVEQNPS